MIPYPAIWEPIFATPTTQKVILLTLSVDGVDPTDPSVHLASRPSSFRFATHPDVTVYDPSTGLRLPFWPYIRSWPVVERVLIREERRAQISDVQVELSASSALPPALFAAGRGMALTGRLDLWSPDVSRTHSGIYLNELYPLAAGLCTVNTIPRLGGPVTITLTDGDPDRIVTFPPNMFNSEDTPNAPEGLLDKVAMTTVVGPMPEDVLAMPIDVDKTTGLCARWFVATPPLSPMPTRVKVNGVILATSEWTTLPVTTASRLQYLELRLMTAVSQETVVAVSGGVGSLTTNLVLYLLDYARYRVSTEARAYLQQFGTLDFSALLNESGNVLDLVRSRFLPQTRFVGTFQHGEFHVLDIKHTIPTFTLSVGEQGLLFRLSEQPSLTSAQAVYNAFEIRCGRNHAASSSSSTSPLVRIILDKDNGPPEYREFLARSEMQWRRRAAPPIEAADLPVVFNVVGIPTGCPGGESLAKLSAVIHAFRHSTHAYQANWTTGMRLNWGHYGYLTDPDMGFVRKPVRVTRWALAPTGPQVFLQTDDALEG